MTIRIDEKRIFEVIEHKKPRSVALNGPEALIPKLQDVADLIAETFGIQVYIIGVGRRHPVQYRPHHCNGHFWPEGHDGTRI
jgi:hypothetical protein